MKKVYIKPVLEIEKFTLNEAIAANCVEKVNLGPADVVAGKNACSVGDWDDDFIVTFSVTYSAQGTSFYDGENGDTICDCYYTAGGEGYFTS